ncbi:hypothetical protein HDU93_006459 [Gonapodya sp. JEL0774]|nr:hypothetical protein HDU93_006459 [Gonapodya sp. JEL0774]
MIGDVIATGTATGSGETPLVPLPEPESTVAPFLHWLFRTSLDPVITPATVLPLLEFADKYDVPHLTRDVLKYLMETKPVPVPELEVFVVAVRLGIKELEEMVWVGASKVLLAAEGDKKLMELIGRLGPEAVTQVLQRRRVEEHRIFRFLITSSNTTGYMRKQCEQRGYENSSTSRRCDICAKNKSFTRTEWAEHVNSCVKPKCAEFGIDAEFWSC